MTRLLLPTALILLFFSYRAPYLDEVFLSIDESVYAAIADQLNAGQVLYKDTWERHPPAVMWLYAFLFRLTGRSMIAVHLFIAIWLLVVIWLVARLAREFEEWLFPGGGKGDVYSVLLGVVFLNAFYINEFHTTNTEMLMVLPLTLSLWSGLRALRFPGKALWWWAGSGAGVGLAVGCKQVALANGAALAGVIVLGCFLPGELFSQRLGRAGKSLAAIAGGFVPGLLPWTLIVAWQGALGDMVFQNYAVNFQYTGSGAKALSWGDVWVRFADVVGPHTFLWLAGWGGSLFLLLRAIDRWRRKKEERAQLEGSILLFLWLLTSLGALSAGWRFFGHYFIQIIPFLALTGGILLSYVAQKVQLRWGVTARKTLLAALLIPGLVGPSWYYPCRYGVTKKYPHLAFYIPPEKRKLIIVPKGLDAVGPPVFLLDLGKKLSRRARIKPAEEVVGDYLRTHSTPQEKVFIWGFFSQAYFYADRLCGTRFTFCDFLTPHEAGGVDDPETIIPGARELLIKDLVSNKPQFIVDTSTADYFGYGAYPMASVPGLKELVDREYEKVENIMGYDIYQRFRLIRRIQ